jgi:hypothetical protein
VKSPFGKYKKRDGIFHRKLAFRAPELELFLAAFRQDALQLGLRIREESVKVIKSWLASVVGQMESAWM